MKILFVISTLRCGGAERVCSIIASKFSETNEVVLAKFDSDEPFYEIDSRVKLVNLNQGVGDLGFLRNLKKRFSKFFSLREMIKEGKFDAVVSFLDSTNILVLMSAIGLKTPVIISEHTSFNAPKKPIIKVLKYIFYPFADALSVLTKEDRRYYSKFCRNVEVIYNPSFSKNNEGLDGLKENLVIFVGRLNELKNCGMFIRVAANLKDFGYKFIVAGDGEQREKLQMLSKQLGAQIEFLGNVADVEKLYKRAKILISTSIVEGLGNTLIEAIGYNCARVATKTSGAKELITHGFDGFLCEINDDKIMSEMVLNLIQDETRRDELCKNARAGLWEFSVDNIYEKWLNMIKEAV